MELGGVPQKIDEYVHLGPIFYVCSSARNWVSFMYKGIYHICNSLWGVATLDVWSSSTRTFQQKIRSPEMTNFFLYCIKKWVFQARRVPPTTGVVELWQKKLFCNENQWNWRWWSSKNWWHMFTGDLYSMYVVLQGIGSLPCIRVYIISVIPFGK